MSPSTAPGQYLGFSLQTNRLLHRLLLAKKGGVVSLEVLGDVASHEAGGRVELEETKSRTSLANPVADRAVDLWKTFENWLSAIEAGRFDLETSSFVLHVNGDFRGSIVDSFCEAQDPELAALAITAAETELLEGEKKLAASLQSHVAFVFDPARRDTLLQVVTRFALQSGSSLSYQEMIDCLEEKAVPSEVADVVLIDLLGWTKHQADSAITAGVATMISQREFATELTAKLRRIDWGIIVASLAAAPSEEDISLEKERTYVRQLDLIEVDRDDTLRAISDFLRARTDRIEWSARGIIHGTSFDELEDDLVSAWSSYRRRVSIQAKEASSTEKGQFLFSECCLHRATLQGQIPPTHFIRGSFHTLADDQAVGWHPNYKTLLDEVDG